MLTVNQTADVLTSFLERGDWGEAIEAVVPARKVVKIKDAERARDEDEDEDEDASPTADDDDDAPTSTDGAPR